MSDKTAEMKALLEERLKSLRDRVAEMNETLREPEDDDLEEQAVEVDDDELLQRLAQAGRAEIQLIGAALQRIDKGTYGKCITCGKEIPERRLQALPEAETCLDCAQRGSTR